MWVCVRVCVYMCRQWILMFRPTPKHTSHGWHVPDAQADKHSVWSKDKHSTNWLIATLPTCFGISPMDIHCCTAIHLFIHFHLFRILCVFVLYAVICLQSVEQMQFWLPQIEWTTLSSDKTWAVQIGQNLWLIQRLFFYIGEGYEEKKDIKTRLKLSWRP